ncbi:polyribonucleotide nucleotidyltransferase [Enterobacteriaceae endosymbiont of Macroplea appendiculata]|uniref:polyribonucleotide nucleotidyltransferase n=1 Tax=Enterobacteriaceae endosymbiont of Macroplea appendiculata TaxID=2675790 RepID=UPI0014493F0B|nr:polyribonucleotide nucleotidyltransferase [Enterobacteriaceae endosymbiont of Macroplea appendiculata]QJC30911.1 polyribonucleotide nucleotidyltransferase [Enterobacteriaceae endosymbiont of Macroplea appendiculata]
MLNPIIHTFSYGDNTVTIETGMIARQTTSAVVVNINGTTVLVTIVINKNIKKEQNFLPLSVHYQEKSYAAGRIPGNFFRRESRPSENEMLIARLIDRPLRPLFPKGFLYDIQIIATVISINPNIYPDVVAIIGVSAALSISNIPFNGPIGTARIGYINKCFVLNPSITKMKHSQLDLIITGTQKEILMVEAKTNQLDETEILNAIIYGHKQQQQLISNIIMFAEKVNIPRDNQVWIINPINKELQKNITTLAKLDLIKAYHIPEKQDRINQIDIIKLNTIEAIHKQDPNINQHDINEIFHELEKEIVRTQILIDNIRIDGRKHNMIRNLDVRTGILSRTHGSSLFTRGETQALVTVTLGTSRDAQILDDLIGEKTDHLLFHYNFPAYAVGETGILSSPKRREIGHGHLAKKAILPVMPTLEKFPYTIRLVSEITESNGSSSMASVCGASLAMMDAGIPITNAVAGIAMGLIKEKDNFVILTDILGDEDHLGDMDFKVAGTNKGITALQMDMKIKGITPTIIKLSLKQAKLARLHILKIMQKNISIPKKHISEFAPRIHILKINPEKIKDMIGKGGSVIRALTEETETVIEIEDSGIVKIAAQNYTQIQFAIRRIEEITADIIVGRIYSGKVTRILDFGAFISIGHGKEGLVHISQITNTHVNKVSDHLTLLQKVLVKVIEIDKQGRIRLSMKATTRR